MIYDEIDELLRLLYEASRALARGRLFTQGPPDEALLAHYGEVARAALQLESRIDVPNALARQALRDLARAARLLGKVVGLLQWGAMYPGMGVPADVERAFMIEMRARRQFRRVRMLLWLLEEGTPERAAPRASRIRREANLLLREVVPLARRLVNLYADRSEPGYGASPGFFGPRAA